MNCVSAGETGGSAPFVVGGRTRVGFPGAPGWTTTGDAGAACCAQTLKEGKLARALVATSAHKHAAKLNTTRISHGRPTWRGLTLRMRLIIVSLTLSPLIVGTLPACSPLAATAALR